MFKKRIDFKKIAYRVVMPILTAIVLGLEAFLLYKFPEKALIFGIGGIVAYVVIFIAIAVLAGVLDKKTREKVGPRIEDVIYDRVNVEGVPCVICDINNKILWTNKFTPKAINKKSVVGMSVEKLFGYVLKENSTPKNKTPESVLYADERYVVDETRLDSGEERCFLLSFVNITELTERKTFIRNKEKVVAYVIIDNIDEILRFEQERYREISAKIEVILRGWCDSVNGMLKEYEKDKYIFIFDREDLDEFIKSEFDVLDKVREIKAGRSNIPVTLSMGIASVEGTMGEKEKIAQQALDMALQRGGDQAAVRIGERVLFYGGLVNTLQNRVKVRSRVIASELLTCINEAGNVLVMAHKFPDYDAIGASVGIARLAMMCKKKVNIVTAFKDANVKRCLKLLEGYDNIKGVFVNASKGLDLVRTDTLLIVVDVNNAKMFESPELAKMVDNIIYIDHHRKTAEFEKEPLLSYIEPSASSASEIVAELLEQVLPVDFLTPMDANMIYSGILLDTKHFTKGVGTKTHSASMYLRDHGAQYESIQNLFKTNLFDYKKEIKYAETLDTYRNCFAIAINENGKDSLDRIMNAKVADKMLSLEGVSASFALVRIGNTVAISARSNGSVNVQLILEELKGGGRFDEAGAQVVLNEKMPNMQRVLDRLKQAIDDKINMDE